jgi:hypothetical protein
MNVPVVAFAATEIVAGTVTAESSLARLTEAPLAPAAALSVTEQLSVPAPVSVALLHEMALTDGCDTGGLLTVCPVPLNGRVILPALALLTTVSVPAADPAAVGLNCTLMLRLPPPAIAAGSPFWLVRVKYCPATLIWVTWTETALAFLSETLAVAVCPTVTSPKESEVVDATRLPAVTSLVFPAMLPQPDRMAITQNAATARIA